MVPKYYRFTFYLGSFTRTDVTWRVYSAKAFAQDCAAFGANGTMFLAEFDYADREQGTDKPPSMRKRNVKTSADMTPDELAARREFHAKMKAKRPTN